MIVHFSAHISKWELVCKFGVIFHIFIISCLCSRFHVRNQWFFLLCNNLFIYQVLCTLIYRRRSLYSFLLNNTMYFVIRSFSPWPYIFWNKIRVIVAYIKQKLKYLSLYNDHCHCQCMQTYWWFCSKVYMWQRWWDFNRLTHSGDNELGQHWLR